MLEGGVFGNQGTVLVFLPMISEIYFSKLELYSSRSCNKTLLIINKNGEPTHYYRPVIHCIFIASVRNPIVQPCELYTLGAVYGIVSTLNFPLMPQQPGVQDFRFERILLSNLTYICITEFILFMFRETATSLSYRDKKQGRTYKDFHHRQKSIPCHIYLLLNP